jgi:hypothetical protein
MVLEVLEILHQLAPLKGIAEEMVFLAQQVVAAVVVLVPREQVVLHQAVALVAMVAQELHHPYLALA